MCGCTCTPRPCRRAHRSTRSCTARAESRRAATADEHRARVGAGSWRGAARFAQRREERRALCEPALERRNRVPADRQDARFAALAQHPHRAVLRDRATPTSRLTSSVKRSPEE